MKAVFRCDATASIGFGHLSRCIALAEALALFDVSSTFAGQYAAAAKAQIEAAGLDLIDFSAPVNSRSAAIEASEITADFLVIDSYRVDEEYLSDLKALGHATVVIDDFCKLVDYPCDAVLNFTWEAPTLAYPHGPHLILGHNNMLARRKLVEQRENSIGKDRQQTIANLLVAIGGADPKGLALRIARLLSDIDTKLCVHVLAEESGEMLAMLERFEPDSRIVPRQPDLSEQLVWADAAITGGGLIKYESAYMGVPAAAIAQNAGQDGETKVFSQAGLVFDLGLADSVSDEELSGSIRTFLASTDRRTQMITRMQEAFIPDPTAQAAKAILEALSAE